MPVSHAVMVEGFLQITSEARLSVKQLCKALIQQGNDERWPVAGREGACFFFLSAKKWMAERCFWRRGKNVLKGKV